MILKAPHLINNKNIMSNKLYILFSGILVSATMIGLFVATSKMQANKIAASHHQQATTSQSANQKKTAVANTEKDRALTILNMWYDLSSDTETTGIRLDSNVKQARKVGMHSDLLAAIKPGYRIQLPSLIGDHYFLKLDKIEKISESEMQIYGELEDKDESYFSTISIIDNTLLAVLSTPKGDYDIKMMDGRGVVYKSGTDTNVGSVIDKPGFLDTE